MRSSILILSAGASLALAGPVAKRDVVYNYVVETDVVTTFYTVTADPVVSTSTAVNNGFKGKKPHNNAASSEAVEATTTSSEEPAVVTVTVGASDAEPTTTAVTSSSTTAVAVAAAATPSDFASTAVYQHNLHRVNNSAPDVAWDDTYASYAQQVSASCVFAHNLTPGGGGYGQNIAMWASSGDAESLGAEMAISQAITNMWYDGEIDLYPSSAYGSSSDPDMSNFEGWGHYSQVVWVGSTQIGCDARYCPAGTMEPDMGAWYSVCNYYPAGNVGGEYSANVLAPQGHPVVTA